MVVGINDHLTGDAAVAAAVETGAVEVYKVWRGGGGCVGGGLCL